MNPANLIKFMVKSSLYIADINRALKDIKSDIITDFIYTDYYGLIITTNKVMSTPDLSTIEKYIKNINVINPEEIITLRLSQLKLYLKILSILYLIKDTNVSINSDIVKRVIKSILYDIVFASRL